MSQKEFELLEKQIKAGRNGDETLLVGIGDDAAVVAGNSSLKYSYTTDATIEGVHFSRRYFSVADIARKVVAVNFSDLAAMGATPEYLLSSIIAPHHFEVGELIDAIAEEVSKYGAELIGGNLSQGDTLAVTATAIGTSPAQSQLLLRSGATEGDLLYTTGPLGASSAGLRSFNARASNYALEEHSPAMEWFHLNPMAKVNEGICLREAGVRCAIDLSDGLVGDLRHIARRSGVRIVIDDPPQRNGATLDDCLYGGEDYELIFAAPPSLEIVEIFKESRLEAPICFGHVEAGDATVVATRIELNRSGFEHVF